MSSVNIDSAIALRWKQRNLNSLFKQFWTNPAETAFHPLNDTEARPLTPMPYCVYEKGTAVRTGNSTGRDCEPANLIEYWQQPVSFRLHAATPARGSAHFGRTGKDILREIIGQGYPDGYGVLGAFDDMAGRLTMGGNDTHSHTETGADFHTREDDDVWVWVLQFDIFFERRREQRGAA